jgi:hypothetical protein
MLLAELIPTVMRTRSCWWVAVSFALLLLPTSAWADVQACVVAHSDGQLARDEGKLLQAVTLFRQCAATECPGPIQKDCSEFLSDAQTRLPSVVLSAQDGDGNDVLDVTVTLDGNPIDNPLSGLAIPVDPGQRRFEFVRPDGTRVQVDLIAQEGVQRRPVTAFFESKPPESVTLAAKPQVVATPIEEPSAFVGKPLALVLAGVGTVALGGFAYFALDGKAQQSELERTCAPNCTSAERGQVEQAYLLADISLAASAVAFSGAAYFYFSAVPSPSPETGSLQWNLVARGRF